MIVTTLFVYRHEIEVGWMKHKGTNLRADQAITTKWKVNIQPAFNPVDLFIRLLKKIVADFAAPFCSSQG